MQTFEMEMTFRAADRMFDAALKWKDGAAFDRARDTSRAAWLEYIHSTPESLAEVARRLQHVEKDLALDGEAPLSPLRPLILETVKAIKSRRPKPWLAQRLRAIAELADDYAGSTWQHEYVTLLWSTVAGATTPRLHS